MSRFLCLLIMLIFCVSAEAAKPIDVVLDSITYRLNVESNAFTVIKGDFNIQNANILDSIEYGGIRYPVTSIERYAFGDGVNFIANVKLRTVNIPNTIKEIGNNAFYECVNLESISLPDSLTSIGTQALGCCFNLKEISLPPTLKFIGPLAFQENKNLEKVIFNGGDIIIDYGAFNDCSNLKNVYVPSLEDWLSLDFLSFSYWEGATPLSAASANLYINDELCANIIIPENILKVKKLSFTKCASLHSVKFPNDLEYIETAAFYNCENLREIELGTGIKAIYNYAFACCESLQIVKINAVEPPILENAFNDSYPGFMTLHIPEGTKEAYEKVDGWKNFGTIIDDLPNDSGIEEVSIDEFKPIEIYDLNGVCIFSGTNNFDLPSGLYIIKQGNITKKVIIK